MRGRFFIAFSGLCLAGACATSAAESGYAYLFATCMQEAVAETPRNICEAAPGAAPKYVIITTNVIDTNKGRDPLLRFREAAGRELNLDIEGQMSAPLPTRAAAEESLAGSLATNRRIEKDAVFVAIKLSEQ